MISCGYKVEYAVWLNVFGDNANNINGSIEVEYVKLELNVNDSVPLILLYSSVLSSY